MEDKLQETTDKNQENGEKQNSAMREVLSWVLYFAAALLITLVLKNYEIINADVPTGSMEDTPERGDIVIFRYPDDEESLYVKRVIGLPGETVDITDGKIYIDGNEKPLEEDYLKETWTVATGDYHFEIPEDAYLMLGDNRNDSWDARYWTNTYVYGDKILGKAEVVYWPFNDIGKLK